VLAGVAVPEPYRQLRLFDWRAGSRTGMIRGASDDLAGTRTTPPRSGTLGERIGGACPRS
jgi:hypothetical protein